jgi:hypothetical protein
MAAPGRVGGHPFSWRMVQDGVEWLGESLKLRYDIEVEPPPPPTSGEPTVSLVQQDPSSF